MAFFYVSQVLGRPVRTGRGERVARIKDIVARLEVSDPAGEVSLEPFPPISGLVVAIEHRDIFIPWNRVRSLGPDGAHLASARVDLRSFQRREGEVLLYRDILDKQLIDIDGRRVIRANDLQLYSLEDTVRLTAVDVSGEALLRRLANGHLFASPVAGGDHPAAVTRGGRRRATKPSLIAWADVEPLRAGVPDVRLRLPHERLSLLNPVDIARIAEDLSYNQGAEIIESLDDVTAADTLQEMDEDRGAAFVESMDQERVADILEEMDPDDAADLLGDLEEKHAEDLLRRMDREDAEDVEELLAYPEDSAGGLMTTDFISVSPRATADDALRFMRSMEDAPDLIDYLYVVEDAEGEDWRPLAREGGRRLLGIVSLRDLLLSSGTAHLGDIMRTDVATIHCDEPQEKAARMMSDYNLLALPVVDDEDRILGIITVDDAMEILLPEPWLKRLPRIFG